MRPFHILQSKMARWPKEQPSTWYSQYKRGSLVSGHGGACLPHSLARGSAWHSWPLGAAPALAPLAELLHGTWRQDSASAPTPQPRQQFIRPGSRALVFQSGLEQELGAQGARVPPGVGAKDTRSQRVLFCSVLVGRSDETGPGPLNHEFFPGHGPLRPLVVAAG